MASIGFPPPAARFPILSESARPASLRPGGVAPGDRPERPHRSARPERSERPAEVFQRGRSQLAHATVRIIHEAKTIIKNGGTMEDVEALANNILEEIPALEKFPPFQKILARIAYNLNNGPAPVDPAPIDPAPIDPAPLDPAPLDPDALIPAEAVASLIEGDPDAAGEPETTLPLTGVSIVV